MLTAVIAALAWFGGHSGTIHKADHQVAGWIVTVRSDRFTGAVSCGARRGEVSLRGPVALFSLGRDVDTTDAVYRINQGAAHSATEVTFRLRALGVPLALEPIDNPSRGLVVLPLSELTDASDVWIRTEPKAPPRRFPLAGVKQVIAYEASAACG